MMPTPLAPTPSLLRAAVHRPPHRRTPARHARLPPAPGRRFAVGLASALVLLLPAPQPGAAQEIQRGDVLPSEYTEDVLALVNDPTTLQLDGDAVIPEARTELGTVAVNGGRLTVNGIIRGDVIVLNGDLIFGPEGRIEGDALVLGGEVRPEEASRVSGILTIYARGLAVFRGEDGRLRPRSRFQEDRRGLYFAGSRFTVRTGSGYNRVEGLPIMFGPVVRTSGRYPFEFDALAIFRTESGFSLDDLGYAFRAEQAFGQAPLWRIGATAFSEVRPIEEWNVSRLSASLSAFLFRNDIRDYYQTEGWTAYLEAAGESTPVSARLEFHHEDHYPAIQGNPFSLLDQLEEWRPMALAGRGDINWLETSLRVDRRNNPEDPTDGWLLDLGGRFGLTGNLVIPSYVQGVSNPPVPEQPLRDDFVLGQLDLRRYVRLDPDSDLALRVRLAGSMNGESIPPQFQHSLGGIGTLPARNRFEVDCQARAVRGVPVDEPNPRTAYPRYGCDAVVLFDVEFREEFWFDLDLRADGRRPGWHIWPEVDLDIAWTAFLTAGQGWSFLEGVPDSGTLADGGLGISVGNLGLYVAYPLNGAADDPKIFVQFGRRF